MNALPTWGRETARQLIRQLARPGPVECLEHEALVSAAVEVGDADAFRRRQSEAGEVLEGRGAPGPPGLRVRVGEIGAVDADLQKTLLERERRGWDSLCDSTADVFYGDLMTDDAVMALANGEVMDRAAVVAALGQTPPWRTYDISDVRVVDTGTDSVALVYVGSAYRDAEDPAFVGGRPEPSADLLGQRDDVEPTVTVRSPHHCDVDSDIVEPDDGVHPTPLDCVLMVQLHAEFEKERGR